MYNKHEYKMDGMHKMAKKKVLEDLRDTAKHAMAGKLDGLKKVEVMAHDKEGLKEGLDKAKEMAEHGDMHDKGEDGGSEPALPFEGKESPEEELAEEHMMGEKSPEECSPEELDHKIAELQALKAKKMGKHHNPY